VGGARHGRACYDAAAVPDAYYGRHHIQLRISRAGNLQGYGQSANEWLCESNGSRQLDRHCSALHNDANANNNDANDDDANNNDANDDDANNNDANDDDANANDDAWRWVQSLLLSNLVVGNLTLGSGQPALLWTMVGGAYLGGCRHYRSCNLDSSVLLAVRPHVLAVLYAA